VTETVFNLAAVTRSGHTELGAIVAAHRGLRRTVGPGRHRSHSAQRGE
jgi:hypothetical protein